MPYHYQETQRHFEAIAHRIEQAVYTPIADLTVNAWITAEPVPFSERLTGRKVEIAIGQSWGKLWDCGWFHFTGEIPASARELKVVSLIDLSGEGCVVDDVGCPILGLTTLSSSYDLSLGMPGKRVVEFAKVTEGSERVDIWAEAGANDLFGRYQDNGILKEASIAICHEEIRQLSHDFFVLHELSMLLSDGSARRAHIVAALYAAALCLSEFTDDEARQAREILAVELAKVGGTPSLTISAVGHAHIDLAWLWPLRETIRKGARTFATVLALMDRYPDYVFGASQPQLYQWTKDHYPPLYEKVKRKVTEGRWEVQGGMWVEPDTNISGGEALIRQLLYGKRFFRSEFGKDPKILWLPDVFGYSGALPQLLKKSGVDYFLTIKISWNRFNAFPHHTFFWQGIDGSRVLAHMPPEGTYNSSAAPRAVFAAEQQYRDKYVSDRCLMLFGIGDGGGGPGEEHLERLSREKDLAGLCPVVQEPAEVFFQRLEKDTPHYNTWAGELYLETHQGTFTTQGRNKRFNRKLEYALRDTELYSTLAHQLCGSVYPSGELDAIWKEMLLYQFHDILPGSSITRVYDESRARYQILLDQTEELSAQARKALIGMINTRGFHQPVVLTNSLSWERNEWLRIRDVWVKATVPPMGYATIELAASDIDVSPLHASPGKLENDKLRVMFAEDGSIQSLWDKDLAREIIPSALSGNTLALYDDQGDAWDFPYGYEEKPPHLFTLTSAEASIDGPRAILQHTYRSGQSVLTQQVVLTLGSRRLDFVTTVDWREKKKMLRTRFPVTVRASEATCDIQFGTVKRPTHDNTSWDYAKYEIPAHKWVDLSQPDYGVALMNDCKYGYRVGESFLDLNLLRSPVWPDPQADQGRHEFTYSLFPHAGDHLVGGVIRAGYDLNVPLRFLESDAHEGELPHLKSFLNVNAANVIIEAVKKAEDSEAMIVRLYESGGAQTNARLQLNLATEPPSIGLATMMEEDIKPLMPEAGDTVVTFGPFEIHTIKVVTRA